MVQTINQRVAVLAERTEGVADPVDVAVGARIRLLRKMRGL